MKQKKTDRHYYKGLYKHKCLCSDPRCEDAWKRWVDLNDDRRCGFVQLHLAPLEENTASQQAEMRWLGVVYHHIVGFGTKVPRRAGASDQTRTYVAFHHWNPALLQPNNKGPVSLTTIAMGKTLGYSNSDRLPAETIEEAGYFAAPNYIYERMNIDLEIAERSALIDSEISPASAVSVAPQRKTPRQRKVDHLIRQAEFDPESTAVALLATKDELEHLHIDFERLKMENERLEQENGELRDNLESIANVFREVGLNRITFSSDAWHEKYPCAANVLFGFRTWKSTKA
jgi:hypothetical protein